MRVYQNYMENILKLQHHFSHKSSLDLSVLESPDGSSVDVVGL